jgi:hypothetical protein
VYVKCSVTDAMAILAVADGQSGPIVPFHRLDCQPTNDTVAVIGHGPPDGRDEAALGNAGGVNTDYETVLLQWRGGSVLSGWEPHSLSTAAAAARFRGSGCGTLFGIQGEQKASARA